MAGNKRAKRDLAKRQKAGDYSGGAEAIMSTYGNKRLKATRGDREGGPTGYSEAEEYGVTPLGRDPQANYIQDLHHDRRQEGRRNSPQ